MERKEAKEEEEEEIELGTPEEIGSVIDQSFEVIMHSQEKITQLKKEREKIEKEIALFQQVGVSHQHQIPADREEEKKWTEETKKKGEELEKLVARKKDLIGQIEQLEK